MLLRLIALSCLVAVTAAQAYYYCNTSSIDATRDSDVLLYTRDRALSYYTEGQICEFNVIGPMNSTFFVNVYAFYVRTAVCTISSGGRIMFNGSSMPVSKYAMVSSTSSLQLRFNATGDSSRDMGVVVRVQVVDFNQCPFRWWKKHGSCYGTSIDENESVLRVLNYTEAQVACITMRSNLLTIPSNYTSNIRSFIDSVSYTIPDRYYAWVGITDRATQNDPYWLDGLRQSVVTELMCKSSDNYGKCSTKERCGTVHKSSWGIYNVYMQDCNDKQPFLCAMPLGGTDKFYDVPEVDSVVHPSPMTFGTWIWILFGCFLLVLGLLVGGLILRLRARRSLAQVEANQANTQSVTSSTDVTASHQSTPHHAVRQQQPMQPYPVQDSLQYPVQYPDEAVSAAELPPPPSYSEVMASNQPFDLTLGTGASIHYDTKLQ